MTPVYTGGCQCGAVRYRMTGEVADSSVCHCRMCQKAFGAYYAPLVSTRGTEFQWTRGMPKRFASSNYVMRGFCENCGTPLTYEAPDGIAISAGSLDAPSQLPPRMQWGIENRIGFVDHIAALPGEETLADVTSASFLPDVVSNQHPDHDTADWTVTPSSAVGAPDHWRPPEQGV